MIFGKEYSGKLVNNTWTKLLKPVIRCSEDWIAGNVAVVSLCTTMIAIQIFFWRKPLKNMISSVSTCSTGNAEGVCVRVLGCAREDERVGWGSFSFLQSLASRSAVRTLTPSETSHTFVAVWNKCDFERIMLWTGK